MKVLNAVFYNFLCGDSTCWLCQCISMFDGEIISRFMSYIVTVVLLLVLREICCELTYAQLAIFREHLHVAYRIPLTVGVTDFKAQRRYVSMSVLSAVFYYLAESSHGPTGLF